MKIDSEQGLRNIILDDRWKEVNILLLGGGSNVLFTQNFAGLVLLNQIRGIAITKDNDREVHLRVGAGEGWHAFVQYCVDHNYAGVENLSLIPGTVGAAPMQNIGAYGVEVKDVIETVEAISRSDGQLRIFSAAECQFGYRESIFKQRLKGKYFITAVNFRLSKQPDFNISYGDIQKVLDEKPHESLSLRAVSEAVIKIRQSKLPDPAKIGNAGSFFKNPEITLDHFHKLKLNYPTMPGYPTGLGMKVPAGWLIEQAGWKGYREGSIGVHDRQALVLVNYGGGAGEDIKSLAFRIQKSVQDRYQILLSPEVNFI